MRISVVKQLLQCLSFQSCIGIRGNKPTCLIERGNFVYNSGSKLFFLYLRFFFPRYEDNNIISLNTIFDIRQSIFHDNYNILNAIYLGLYGYNLRDRFNYFTTFTFHFTTLTSTGRFKLHRLLYFIRAVSESPFQRMIA